MHYKNYMYLRLICLFLPIIITFVCYMFISKIYNKRINLAPTAENSSLVQYYPYIVIGGGGEGASAVITSNISGIDTTYVVGGGGDDGHKGIIDGTIRMK